MTWSYRAMLASTAYDDTPVRDAMLDRARESAVAMAAGQGVHLISEPTMRASRTVVVPDWDEHGPAPVATDVAVLLGHDPADLPDGPVIVYLEWDT